MPRFKINYFVILMSFIFFNIFFAIYFEYLGRSYPMSPCLEDTSKELKHFTIVSKDFWDGICRHGNVLVTSSEGTGNFDFNDAFSSKYNIKFQSLVGQHRGLKTAAYISSHQISDERLKKLKMLVLVNPVYWLKTFADIDEGAAHQSALSYFSYASRVKISQNWFNIFGNMSITAREYANNYLKNNYFESVFSYDRFTSEVPMKNQPENYNVEKSMFEENYKHASKEPLSWSFEQHIEPMDSLIEKFKVEMAAKKIPYCLVMLPLNERFLSEGKMNILDSKKMIKFHFRNIPAERRVDLMDLGIEPYIFQDVMHFTSFGRAIITERVFQSACFNSVFGEQ